MWIQANDVSKRAQIGYQQKFIDKMKIRKNLMSKSKMQQHFTLQRRDSIKLNKKKIQNWKGKKVNILFIQSLSYFEVVNFRIPGEEKKIAKSVKNNQGRKKKTSQS